VGFFIAQANFGYCWGVGPAGIFAGLLVITP
jgi:hypothetical protein